MSFKVGQKIVCIKYDPICELSKTIMPAPKKHEIVTIINIKQDDGYFMLKEYNEYYSYKPKDFRPLNHDFANNLLNNIKPEYESNK